MKQIKKKRWSDYLWIVSSTYFILGFFSIAYAWVGLLCLGTALIVSIAGGGKIWCNSYCGRGQIFMHVGNTFHLTRRAAPPRWLSSKCFRNTFLAIFLLTFAEVIYVTILVAQGLQDMHQTIHLFWTFDVPWNWTYSDAISPMHAQFAFGLYGLMLTSLIIGIVLTIVYRPRTWCVFCPMGNITQMISKAKAKE